MRKLGQSCTIMHASVLFIFNEKKILQNWSIKWHSSEPNFLFILFSMYSMWELCFHSWAICHIIKTHHRIMSTNYCCNRDEIHHFLITVVSTKKAHTHTHLLRRNHQKIWFTWVPFHQPILQEFFCIEKKCNCIIGQHYSMLIFSY